VSDATKSDSSGTEDHPNNNIDLNYITPRALLEAKAAAESRAANSDRQAESLTPEERSRTKMIVYVYGEPALAMHLHNAGVIVVPVSHLNLRAPGETIPVVPTFVVFGPNAKRTPGFWEELMVQSDYLRSLRKIEYRPGLVTLLDLFTPKWLDEHPEAELQALEVYRVE